MNEIDEERLYGLIEIAERQQGSAQAALDGLATERAALAQEREEWANTLGAISDELREAMRTFLSENAASVAAEPSADMSQDLVQPVADVLARVSTEAKEAEATLRSVVQWASWRLLGWILAVIGGLMLLWWLAAASLLWWDSSAIGAAQVQKAKLQTEIAELQARHDAWVESGAQNKLERCGPKKRLCVRVDESAGPFGSHSDYRIVYGY
jgi:hypothetical protein